MIDEIDQIIVTMIDHDLIVSITMVEGLLSFKIFNFLGLCVVAVSVAIDRLREVLLSLAGFFMHLRT